MNFEQRFHNVLVCLQDLKDNKMIIVPDREDRENEADIITQGNITPEMMNWIATHAKGLICCPTTKQIAAQAGLAKMANFPILSCDTPFTISIDAMQTTTGVSAFDRALTVNTLATGKATLADFKVPGHIFPLIANDHLLKARDGHTEATVTLMKLAGLNETGVCCEIMGDDGHMISGAQIHDFADRFQLNVVTIDEIKDYYYFSQILVDLISFDQHKMVVLDPYSQIHYSFEIFNLGHQNINETCFDVLIMNQYQDVSKNLMQANTVSNYLSRTNNPCLVFDVAQQDMHQVWYVLNSMLHLGQIKNLNLAQLDETWQNIFQLCDVITK